VLDYHLAHLQFVRQSIQFFLRDDGHDWVDDPSDDPAWRAEVKEEYAWAWEGLEEAVE